MYEFTLGDNVYWTDFSTKTSGVRSLSAMPEHSFSSEINNNDFKNICIMNSINSFLNTFYGEKANATAINAETGVRFELAAIDYAEDDATTITKISSIIDGPSFFAVVDINNPLLDQMTRVINFFNICVENQMSNDIMLT